MSLKTISVHNFLEHVRTKFRENVTTGKYTNEEAPLRADLFNTDQLEQHGKYLASTQRVKKGKGPDKLLKRLASNEAVLVSVRNMLTEAIKGNGLVTPAGEWLLDNFYLIEDHIHTGKRHLPKGYSESLPQLVSGASAGMPRVYEIALDLICHSDGRIDADRITSFIKAYQEVANLQLGELWAIPIMLRLALIENLRRVATRVANDRVNRNLAANWAKQMVDTAERDPKSLILVIADMARSDPPMESSFVAELIRQLMWKGASLALPLTWMEQRLSESGLTSNELVNVESQKQAADQVSISNSIGSLRFLGAMEWREFVEDMSVVEHTLRKDISGIYPAMDFATRDHYRHAVEKLARYSSYTELDVAKLVVRLAKKGYNDVNAENGVRKAAESAPQAAPGPEDGPALPRVGKAARGKAPLSVSHVGDYLVGDCVALTEKMVHADLPFRDHFLKTLKRFPLSFYAGSIVLITLGLAGYLSAGIPWGFAKGPGGTWHNALVVFAAFAAVFAASHFATSIVNWIVTLFIKPGLLPRMDFGEGIPSDFKTLVVVPAMLANEPHIERLAEALEVRFLANRDANLLFGLLTDFMDAKAEVMPGDDKLLALAREKIDELNRKYDTQNKFFLFHRPRKWNRFDKIWMGYERKRGKLGELNALIKNGAVEYFSVIEGDVAAVRDVKYIITLDTDTQLPRDSAWKMVGTMAHPLNRPYFDEKKRRITKGYGILQPRVSVSLTMSGQTVYARIHGSEPGIDPYTRLTSDVYQDLFDEGSFIGKGIYDIDAFEHTLSDRFPENRILSHDLLEGCYTRAGLLSDVELYEDYPPQYSSDVNRRHRWIRGDWQIGNWVLPAVPGKDGRLLRNPLSGLARWKIFDNLRRSLVPVALTLLLLLGWTALHAAWFWTLAVIVIIILPSLITSVWNLFRKPKEATLWQHIVLSFSSLADSFLQHAFLFSCLPYEAFYSLDAIARTTWRMLVSHKKLLEWNPSGQQEHTSDKTLRAAYRAMWPGPVVAVATFVYLIIYSPFHLLVAVPVLLLWAMSPAVAWWVSRPLPKREAQLLPGQVAFLRKIARKTWLFFERFVCADENWLPPDNYQESPGGIVAHRTSPTNIGLSFLSSLAAYDFGYITGGMLVERATSSFNTIALLERFRGHLYNWYDTRTLRPLSPKYISTVDSGNLAGHISVFRQGLLSLPGAKILAPGLMDGLRDTLFVIQDLVPGNEVVKQMWQVVYAGSAAFTRPQVKTAVIAREVKTCCDQVLKMCGELLDNAGRTDEQQQWINALMNQCTDISGEITNLLPWALLPAPPGSISDAVWPNGPASFLDKLDPSTLTGISGIGHLAAEIDGLHMQDEPEGKAWLEQLKQCITDAAARADARIAEIEKLATQCAELADIEYEFLFDNTKHLLTIGYNADEHRKDSGDYDLLASEASLCTFVGIAQGKLPQESWFALGRLLAQAGGEPTLLSWSGSMFEYLMPMLVMPVYDNTLIHQTYKNAVARQIAYGTERNVPWGISESGYNMVDANLNYQYRAFGVPGLGLKRGLAEDLVIAPYATVLALMVAPDEACRNMERLSAAGFEGRYGFYEAIDYTASRLPRGQAFAVVQSYMAHHQGMGLLSLAYMLLGQPMQKRFEQELQFQATMLLLQERIPKVATFYTHATDIATAVSTVSETAELRIIQTPNTPAPEIQLLSNGNYHVMITNAGSGYSRWRDFDVTRWREDAARDNYGTFCYIRDLENGTFWSNAYQPTLKQPQHYEVTYTQGRAEIRRIDNKIETYTEIVVSPEDDIEMRRIHITNRSRKRKTMDVTSYAEVVLAPHAADVAHPAFSNLFIQTELLEQKHAIICNRRPRSVDERVPWLFHLVAVRGAQVKEESFETDRAQFIGRGNTIVNPVCMSVPGPLSNSQGAVLDPIVAIRYQVILEPDETVTFEVVTGVSDTRDACQGLIEKYQDKSHKERVFELAWTHSQVVLRQINATEADAQLFAHLAGAIIYANPLMRSDPSVLIRNRRGQSGLWGYSISGDLPIILLQIEDPANIEMARLLVRAHAYWRLKGLAADLVIWNEDYGGYRQVLQNMILGLVSAGNGAELTNYPGGIYIRTADQISNEDRILFEAVARISISDKRGSLEDHINRKAQPKNIPYFIPQRLMQRSVTVLSVPEGLLLFNGYGGFSPDGREYVVISARNNYTPLPWANVLANPQFGTVISESGQSYTWMENAHEYRLSPWGNDPVCDEGGEVFYLRDEDSGNYWSPVPLPAAGTANYITRHGFGYSVFAHAEDGIHSEMQVFVDVEEPVKFYVIKLKNHSPDTRRVSVTGYMEWVLGDVKQKTAMHIITEQDTASGALMARNQYNKEFENCVAFFDTDDPARTFTCDRAEFIGRNGTLRNPDAMMRARLSGKAGAALDPCAAIQSILSLAEGQERIVVFRVGAGKDKDEAMRVIQKFKGANAAADALKRVKNYWDHTLGALRVDTPDPAINILMNGWLMYQAVACRLWARSGYYQSGGAYGFRDQLQDVLAVMPTMPGLARRQILLCASHQFREGDVQHWWHPPAGRGVRTRCSDDLLWLPYVIARYVAKTGDAQVLDEQVLFLEGRNLTADEHSYYDLPIPSATPASLYEHCVAAITKSFNYGAHGLPLMGDGDWNDGMDMVGHKGKGESVWLAFFLYDVLSSFANVARIHADDAFAETCIAEAAQLKYNIDKHAWDGNWYRRAYFDDGSPLGSSSNTECRIDSISQSWSVLSGAGEPERARAALAAADKQLVRPDAMLIQLLDPPFDKSEMNPGYIKGYVPGIRENGGQYTHAAIWMIMAHAMSGNTKRAWELMNMVNPLNHGDTPEKIAMYKAEPYVVAADIYAAQNSGRGGWTWYTGSAGWMYQLIFEWLLGIRLEGVKMRIVPCIPPGWDMCSIDYRYHDTIYHITVLQSAVKTGALSITLDGAPCPDNTIPLVNDQGRHTVEVALGITEKVETAP